MGLIFHSVTLALITIHSPLVRGRVDPELSKLLIALTSVPLIRIVSLISPVIQFSSMVPRDFDSSLLFHIHLNSSYR